MAYLERFNRERQAGKADLAFGGKGFRRRTAGLYPKSLVIADVLFHAAWASTALFFALKISDMSSQAAAAVSLGGMLAAVLLGRFVPLGTVIGGAMLVLGAAILPFYVEAGPIGIFGLSSASGTFRSRRGRALVEKWALESEERFLQAVTEGAIEVIPTEMADADTKLLLSQLEEAVRRGGKALAEEEGPEEEERKDKSDAFPRAKVDLAAAEQYYKESLALKERELGPEHPDVATILNSLAMLYRTEGNYGGAEPLYKRSLAIREKAFGPNHPEVATSLNNLGVLHASKAEYAPAEQLLKRSLAIREKVLGPKHPEVVGSLENLAELYRATGREKEAEELEKRARSLSGRQDQK